jgi:putative transposase
VSELRRKASRASLATLCKLFGKTRQAWYDHQRCQGREALESTVVLDLVREKRARHPKMGTRKLYDRLSDQLKQMGIRIGRDAFFVLLREGGLLIRRRRKGHITTLSRHRFRCYGNQLEGLVIDRPEQVWVTDITYLRLERSFVYLSLVTDAYSRNIMGYHVSPTLEASGCLKALRMAMKNRSYDEPLIHHSDRGIQYCSHEYTSALNQAGIAISMTVSGSAENAIAERVNGILKDEYLLDATFESLEAARRQTAQAIHLYNTDRPHLSLGMLTPEQAHRGQGPLTRMWKARPRKVA